MAIRQRKDRATSWQVYWNNPCTGKRESMSFATQQEAEKHDALMRYRIRYEREYFNTGDNTDEKEQTETVMTFETAYLQYLKQKQFSKKGLTWQMDAMRYPLEKYGQMPAEHINADIARAVLEYQQSRGVKPASVRCRMSVLRTVCKWCMAQGYTPQFAFPPLPAAQYEKFIPPTVEELQRILQVAQPHIQRVVIIGAQLGVRVGQCELLQLTWQDVDLENRVLRVHGSKKNKNAPWREVPIRDALIHVFEDWKRQDANTGVPWLINYKGKQINNIHTAWRNTLSRAGITRRIRPYDLRHAFATEMIAAGVDIGTVANLMGHSTPTMILTHYQYVMDKQKRSAVEALPMCPLCAQDDVPQKKASTLQP